MDITPEAKKRLASLIEERDAALAPLAAKIGVSQSTLWNFVYGSTKNFSKIHRLATEFRVSLDWIMNGDAARAAQNDGGGSPMRLSDNLPGSSHIADSSIPVFGRPASASGSVMISAQGKTGEVERHPAQKNARDSFALCIVGEKMAPRYRPGEMAYAAGKKPPVKGQDCVVELVNGEAHLNEFVAYKGDYILCKQLNPAKNLKWPADEVKALHAVVGRG